MYLFRILVTAIGLTVINAEVDCSNPPPHVNFNDCCELSNGLSKEVKMKCVSLYDNGPPHHHGPPGHRRGPPPNNCFLSCVVNETGILVDDELDEDNVVSYLTELFEDGEKVDFLRNKFLSCNEKRKQYESKWSEQKTGPQHCPSAGIGMILGCVHIHAFKDCPDSSWSDTTECNEARDHFIQCRSNENIDAEEEI